MLPTALAAPDPHRDRSSGRRPRSSHNPALRPPSPSAPDRSTARPARPPEAAHLLSAGDFATAQPALVSPASIRRRTASTQTIRDSSPKSPDQLLACPGPQLVTCDKESPLRQAARRSGYLRSGRPLGRAVEGECKMGGVGGEGLFVTNQPGCCAAATRRPA